MDLKLIGNRIREARENLGLSQEELGARIGKGQNAISLYEMGVRGIHISELPDLAHALEVSIAYFFGDVEPDQEILDLVSKLSPEKQKEMAARLRFEVDLQKQAHIG